MVAIIQEHSKGKLKDGREFEVIDFQKFAFSDDGTIHSGTFGVVIDGNMTYTQYKQLQRTLIMSCFRGLTINRILVLLGK